MSITGTIISITAVGPPTFGKPTRQTQHLPYYIFWMYLIRLPVGRYELVAYSPCTPEVGPGHVCQPLYQKHTPSSAICVHFVLGLR